MPTDEVDDSAATIYFVSLGGASAITITFTPPTGGSVTSVSSDPTGPSTTSNSITFGTAHIDTYYTVTVVYSNGGSGVERGVDSHINPLETPTKKPAFKPVTTCPS